MYMLLLLQIRFLLLYSDEVIVYTLKYEPFFALDLRVYVILWGPKEHKTQSKKASRNVIAFKRQVGGKSRGTRKRVL